MTARRSTFDVLTCFGLGVAVSLVPWLFRPRFYFHDDVQHQHFATFLHIGRILRTGEMPFLSLGSFFGSNLLGEYQYALLNPVSLALYAMLPSFSDAQMAMLFLACFYYGVLASGTFVLARTYGVSSGGAFVAALAMSTNNLICYWFASSWIPIFVSLAWFVWAWAFLARTQRGAAEWLLAILFCYLAITSGWPQTTLMLGLVSIVVAFQAWRSGSTYGAVRAIAAMGAAGLLATTALLALVSLGEVAARFTGVVNNGVLVPNLRDLIVSSSPFHLGFMSWGGYKRTAVPIFFMAWFVLPLLVLIRWDRAVWRDPATIALLVIAGFSLLATQGPEESWALRWPFRWVPYFHIASIILFLRLATLAGFAAPTRLRLGAVALVLALGAVSSLQADPGGWRIHLAGMAGCALAVAIFIALPRAAEGMRFAVLGAVTLLLFAATHALFPVNRDIPDWGVSKEAEAGKAPNSAPAAYALYLGPVGNAADPERLAEFQTGMIPRIAELATINGYTPIGHRAASEFLCMNIFGETCPELGPRLFRTEPETGLTYADLLKIDRLIAHKGAHLDRLRPALGPDWRMQFDGVLTRRFVRELPNAALPGTISWISSGADAEPIGPARATSERVRVTPAATGTTSIVFARLLWPGYKAEYDGREIPVRAVAGMLVAVDLPPATLPGTLILSFRPPHLSLGLAAALLGLIILVAGLLVSRPNGLPGRVPFAA